MMTVDDIVIDWTIDDRKDEARLIADQCWFGRDSLTQANRRPLPIVNELRRCPSILFPGSESRISTGRLSPALRGLSSQSTRRGQFSRLPAGIIDQLIQRGHHLFQELLDRLILEASFAEGHAPLDLHFEDPRVLAW